MTTLSKTFGQQEAQDKIPVSITIIGMDDWHNALAEQKDYTGLWAEEIGKKRASYEESAIVAARLNCISRELGLFSCLMNLGYKLEEADVFFSDDPQNSWGLCSWIKDHPSYKDLKNVWRKTDSSRTDYTISLIDSFFTTENAGEKEFTLTSTALGAGFLFHKQILFNRVVFSKP